MPMPKVRDYYQLAVHLELESRRGEKIRPALGSGEDLRSRIDPLSFP